MPYFINCPRCNAENDYSSVNPKCGKCSGTGRDWRDDYELADYHAWANITIEELQSEKIIANEHYNKPVIFIYRESIPSVQEDKDEIAKAYGQPKKEKTTLVFCNHKWKNLSSEEKEICVVCGRERIGGIIQYRADLTHLSEHTDVLNQSKPTGKILDYNKKIHDSRYYFPNRCCGCKEYASTSGEPETGSDSIFCNIGGEVRADTGCDQFTPDVTASCTDCWNYSNKISEFTEQHICAIHGNLLKKIQGYCHEYVMKEETDTEIPPSEDSVEFSRSLKEKNEYPYDPDCRGKILDAMKLIGIGFVIYEMQSCDHCLFEINKTIDFGHCNHHDVSLLRYNDRSCDSFLWKDSIIKDRHPKLLVSAQLYHGGIRFHRLSDTLLLKADPEPKEKDQEFCLVNSNDHSDICFIEPYLLSSVKFNPDDGYVHANYASSDLDVLINRPLA